MEENQQTPVLKDKNLHIIFGITLSAVMGVSSIAPALPVISRALDVSTDQIGLLITVFALPGILLTPFLGVLADRFGRKRILIPSLLLYGIAGSACAFTTSFDQLLWLRFLQGSGSAALGALNITLIGDLFQGNRRATAMGYNGSVLSVGTAIYPAIGGFLAAFAWNYPFLLSALAIPVALFAMIYLDPVPISMNLDIGEYFQKIKDRIFTRQVLSLFACVFLTFTILYGGYITFLPIFLDEDFGLSSTIIGLMLSGSSLITAITSSRLGKLTKHFSELHLILTGAILYLFIFLSFPLITNVWYMALPIAVFGVAQGINIPSLLNLLTGKAPSEFRAAFLAVNWVVIRAAQTIAPFLLGIVYLYTGIRGTFFFTAGAALLFVGIAAVSLRR
ncbi:MFS transporter [Rhodohalobacter sp. SW132]|uniref:MFS transporter n=1 Tax=Rhodohalobacter sp. SW132 TaxID=2293433 RepID=UPI000E2545BB|nr:MFS transporter [Rhodohalobacter sp. SW132]REL24343.1 MFS transporter [Rhodohalobacter sp. SW132]